MKKAASRTPGAKGRRARTWKAWAVTSCRDSDRLAIDTRGLLLIFASVDDANLWRGGMAENPIRVEIRELPPRRAKGRRAG